MYEIALQYIIFTNDHNLFLHIQGSRLILICTELLYGMLKLSYNVSCVEIMHFNWL